MYMLEQFSEERLTADKAHEQFRSGLYDHFKDAPSMNDPILDEIEGRNALAIILDALKILKHTDLKGQSSQYYARGIFELAVQTCISHGNFPSQEVAYKIVTDRLGGELGALVVEQLSAQIDPVKAALDSVRENLGESAKVINSQVADTSDVDH